MRIPKILCFLILIQLTGYGQEDFGIDSLKNVYLNTTDDSTRILLLDAISVNFRGISLDSSAAYAEKVLDLASKTNSNYLMYKAYTSKARVSTLTSSTDVTGENYEAAWSYLAKEEGYQKEKFDLLFSLIINYDMMGSYKKALETYDLASEIIDSSIYTQKIWLDEALAGIYESQDKKDEAIAIYKTNLKLAEKHDDLIEKSFTAMHLGYAYNFKAEPDSGIVYSKIAEAGFRKLDLRVRLPRVLLNLGYSHYQIGDYAKGVEYFEEGINMAKELNINTGLAGDYANLAHGYSKINNEQKALLNVQKAIPYIDQTSELNNRKIALTRVIQVLKKYKQYEQALKYSDSLLIVKDSLSRKENREAIAEAEAKFQTKEQEATIIAQDLEIERQQNNRSKLIMIAILLLATVASVFQYFLNKQKRKKIETELALQNKEIETNKLKELDQLKSAFFTNLSHELRTPLTLIIAPLKDAIEKLGDSHVKEELDLAHSNSKKLVNLVDEIMDLSKLESGKLTLNQTSKPLKPSLNRMFYVFHSLAELRNIKLNFENKIQGDYQYLTDWSKLEKIINNLVSNAIKYSSNNSQIDFTLDNDEESILISIRDYGNGISEADIPYIFDRFYQTMDKDKKLVGGTGIGLALTNELTKLLGGDISVQSKIKEGTTFTLSLPNKLVPLNEERCLQLETDENEEEQTEIYQSILLNGDKPRILIVEDHPEMSEFLNKILSNNFECDSASNGIEALKMIKKNSYALILSDVMMPEMDGFELKERLTDIPDLNLIPFIILTARSLDEDKLFGFKLGVDDYITKPFNKEELIARSTNLIRNKLEREKVKGDNANTLEQDSSDRALIKNAERSVIKNMSDPNYKVSNLAEDLSTGERQLRRIFKSLTGLSPVEFILELRLQKARRLFERRIYRSVSEVQYEVGIESASYFSKKFKTRFGISPSQLIDDLN